MTKRTDFLRYGVRSLAGLVGAGIAAAVVAALCVIPLPGFTATARSELVTPTPTDQRLVCPGSLLDILSMDGDVSTFAAVGVPDLETSALDTSVTDSVMSTPDVASGDSGSAPVQLFAPAPTTDVTPHIAGIQAQTAASESIAGLAAASCVESNTDTWLVGGSTETGRTTLLLLSNPTEVPANVSVSVIGERGSVTGPGGTGIVVASGSQRVISLASLAPNVLAPVVHVTTTGGQVVATLQQTVIRTLLPDGTEFVTGSAPPNTSLIIPGVRLSGTASGHHSEGGMVTSDEEPAIRVGVPGAEDSAVTVTVMSARAEPVTVKATVPAGRVIELPFPDLDDGVYSLSVSATKPVVAAARTIQAVGVDPFASSTSTPTPVGTATPTPSVTPSTATSATPAAAGTRGVRGSAPAANSDADVASGLAALDDVSGGDGAVGGTPAGSTPYVAPPPELGGDFTWFAAVAPLIGTTLVTVPDVPHPTLTLVNPGKDDITLDVSQDSAKVTHVTVPGQSMKVIDLRGSATYTLTGTQAVFAALTFSGIGLGASVPLSPPSPLGAGIVVYPR